MARAQAVASEAKAAAAGKGDRGLEWRATIQDLAIGLSQDTRGGLAEEAIRVRPAAVEGFAERHDDRWLAKAWMVAASGHNSKGQHPSMLEAAERSLNHARPIGDVTTVLWALSMIGSALYWGPTPAREALARAERLLEDSRGNPLVEARATRILGGAKTLTGDLDEARGLFAQAESVYREFGRKIAVASMGFAWGPLEWMAGDMEAAERALRASCDALEAMGEHGWLSTMVAALGRTLYMLGRYDEADVCAERSKEVAAPDDLVSQIFWRAVRAAVRAWRGREDEARALIREAVDIANGTEGLLWQADVHRSEADVMWLLGDRDEERKALQEALRCYEQKGVPIESVRMRDRLAALSGERSP